MQKLDIPASGKRTCVQAINHMNEHIAWLKERGFTDQNDWIKDAKDTLSFWIDMLKEWESLEE